MSEPRDEELEKRLDTAFTSSRPRRQFEEELWNRVQAHRRGWLERLLAPVRRVELVPALAGLAALLLVVGGGYALLNSRGTAPGGGAAMSAAPKRATQPEALNPAFGKLPVPSQLQGRPAAQPAAATDATPEVQFAWKGRLPAIPAGGRVYRYQEPSHADADAFAARLGASRAPGPQDVVLGYYSGPGFRLILLPTRAGGREPLFVFTPLGSENPGPAGPTDQVARDTATRFLTSHDLPVDQPSELKVQGTPGFPSVVHYYRRFSVDGLSTLAPQVDATGSQTGLDVVVKGDGSVFQASGPLPLTLETATYPFRSSASVEASIPGSNVPASHSRSNLPRVELTRAELVYVVVADGSRSFFEPAWLLSGKYDNRQGLTVDEHVIVPAVDDSQLRR